MTVGHAVSRPALSDLADVCTSLRIPFVVENKGYPRDCVTRGRVRVNLTHIKDPTANTSMSRCMH